MNKLYIIGLALVVTMAACKKENIKTYNAGQYVQFTLKDTVSLSFFFYPGKSEVDVQFPVRLVGKMPEQDLQYKIIAGEGTTLPDALYVIAPVFTFKKGQPVDTAHITIKNSAELTTNTYKLIIEIAADGDVQPGQTNYSQRLCTINDMVSRPVWWDATNELRYLGVYTEKKFRTFMNVTGVGDLTPYTSVEQRDLFLKFKNYLIAMKDAGTPVLEADGTDMLSTVPLIG